VRIHGELWVLGALWSICATITVLAMLRVALTIRHYRTMERVYRLQIATAKGMIARGEGAQHQ
jgi:hypothetical protein